MYVHITLNSRIKLFTDKTGTKCLPKLLEAFLIQVILKMYFDIVVFERLLMFEGHLIIYTYYMQLYLFYAMDSCNPINYSLFTLLN